MSLHRKTEEDDSDKEATKEVPETSSSNVENYYVNKDLIIEEIKEKCSIDMGFLKLKLGAICGGGSTGEVYEASIMSGCSASFPRDLAVKLSRRQNKREYYITSVLHQRLKTLNRGEFGAASTSRALAYGAFKNGSCFVTSLYNLGTLLDVLVYFENHSYGITETVCAFMCMHMFVTVSLCHRCNITHGDIKIDNIVFTRSPRVEDSIGDISEKSPCLCFIDFGNASDHRFKDISEAERAKWTKFFGSSGKLMKVQGTERSDLLRLLVVVNSILFSTRPHLRCLYEYCYPRLLEELQSFQFNEIWTMVYSTLKHKDSDSDPETVEPLISSIREALERNRDLFARELTDFSENMDRYIQDRARKRL